MYKNLCAEVLAEGMKMCEILQANVLIKKFPPSWSYYRNHLKHKKKDLTQQELISHMQTEEANRLKDRMPSLSLNSVNSNLVESVVPMNKNRFKRQREEISEAKSQKSESCQQENSEA